LKSERFWLSERLYTKQSISNRRKCPISSVDQRGSRNKVDKDKRVVCKQGTGIGGVLLAFLTGAGVATTAILIAAKARSAVSPTAEQLLKRCDRAVEALDSQVQQTVAV
jgi:hypothetical protein